MTEFDMAICSSPCSSSSSLKRFLSPSLFNDHDHDHQETSLPRRICIMKWDSDEKNHQRKKHFELKASNLQPFNAVTGVSPVDFSAAEHVEVPAKEGCFDHIFDIDEKSESTLSIVVVGASGDLASTKIFRTLFALFYEDRLPENFTIFGYARTVMTSEELRNLISRTLTCRIGQREKCNDKIERFLGRCFYHSGQYSSEEHFFELDSKLKEKEVGRLSNRLFYLAIPPNVTVDAVRCARRRASSENGWTRVIVEKPFGQDLDSSRELTRDIKQYLSEDQIFRIDHHLNEELIDNLLVLRFSNLVFEPLWSRNYIRNVQFIFSQDSRTDIQGRLVQFDDYGFIRDVMQNHLLQLLALFTMETPVSLDPEDIKNEKVKVLRSMRPVKLEDVVLGQYKGHIDNIAPTFTAATAFVDNSRWDGVPFMLIAGKGLQSNRIEIRVQFRHVPGNLYNRKLGTDLDKTTNELVIRVLPDEAMYLKINSKVPGLGLRLDQTDLNLLYKSRCTPKGIPDACERKLLDEIEGDRRSFVRSDELYAAYEVFSPLLKELERKKVAPELYSCGSTGPVGVHYLAAKHNVHYKDYL
ncbi:hypothetical protein Ddye_015622 [Dipteronia dyeriana]|uniref:Glucose-6-phosphate 1-dehydrogenase n=1 Tax=Dipteronia dyeriana TaxID=168575 RepID=A0AAD9U5X0_9ROSI|nr:hypothetical protein Ddye_015622 [Dipteronia dyeriana]